MPASGRASASAPLMQLAVSHHTSGRLQDAYRLYQTVLAAEPRHSFALSQFGILCHQLGDYQAAVAALQKAVAADKTNPVAHFNLGLAYATVGRDDEAITATLRALKLKPDYAAAETNLGTLKVRGGDASAALPHFARALELEPAVLSCYENYAAALLATGDLRGALDIAAKGLALPESHGLRALFLRALPGLASLTRSQREKYRNLLHRALAEGWCRPNELVPAVCLLLDEDSSTWSQDALWLALLPRTPNTDPTIEHYLTAERRHLLQAVVAGQTAQDLRFSVALAQQCFLNEYVFDMREDERQQKETLRERISTDLVSETSVAPAALAVLACYMPLHHLPDTDRLKAQHRLPELEPLIVQQIDEPKREAQLRSSIARLTVVRDSVSLKVQRMYEENAYPRWTTTVEAPPAPSFSAYLRARLPAQNVLPSDDRKVELLIAGCGTGRQVVEAAGRYAVSRITAIDLSRTSLAYAVRKAEEAGLSDVRFGQADILELDARLGPFDVIESAGVLHHLRDPLQGWRRLLSLLKPGGFMLVALYSRIAHASVRAARSFIAERGYSATPEDIRRLRQEILALPSTHPARAVRQSADFFTVSECRDYLLHVQETEFDLPGISAFLTESGIQFIGFETTAQDAYRRRFPDDPNATNLNNWHTFEHENPATFVSMYQFWVRKPE